DSETKLARYERRRLDEIEIRRIEAALITDLEHVTETIGREKRRSSAAPLEDRVGGESGAVHEPDELMRGDAGQAKRLLDALHERFVGRPMGGQDLARPAVAAELEDDVGEGPTDIGRQPGSSIPLCLVSHRGRIVDTVTGRKCLTRRISCVGRIWQRLMSWAHEVGAKRHFARFLAWLRVTARRRQKERPILDEDGAIRPLDLASVRQEFPIVRERCYLNNASIGPLSNPVVNATQAFLHDVRDHGRNNYPTWCRHADERIKARLGALIGAGPDEIAFVKNTTEGLITVANGLDWRAGDNVVVPDIEYPSNVYCWMRLAKLGVDIKWARSKNGRVTVDSIAEAIDSRTRLVSVSAVQFSNGFCHDLARTSQLFADSKGLVNPDALPLAVAA